ncbi:TatD family deoxyribonuclease [Algoriphagus kandeliae]|uniref:TatD family deoxyribonuclease n=1 Tax=Algoriphagus kandeliae TaxID=2562278 RepID=A0A4Y9QLW2_9BACT|nr:TatD family hydrolase [Algoriphagus kandeliae]TFV93187.1 TatD family deoxyribonuclease [Algoriphagus kandeliae]
MNLIDTHAHIYSRKFESDKDAVMQEIREAGVERIYMPNIDVESIDEMLEMEKSYPGFCIPMMGLHPCDVKEDFEAQLEVMKDWLWKRPFAAVGEIGLDLYWDKTFFEEQKQALREQITWAKSLNLPIVLHCRDSMDETIAIVREMQDGNLKGIFHCFTGNLDQAQQIIELGFLLGIGGVVTYKNGGLDQVLPHLKLKNLVLETDAPYLAPVPFRGKRNTPAYLPYIAERVGDLMKISSSEVARVTKENALALFKEFDYEL